MTWRAVATLLPLLLAPAARAATAPTLADAVHAPTRSPALVARDGARHPAAELAFFGVRPDSDVVEIWPGGGYWTQILAPYLHDGGTYTLAMGIAGSPDEAERAFAFKPKFQAMLAAHPEVYGRIKLTTFGASHPVLAPPGSVDVVLTFRNLHNWMAAGDAPALLAAIHDALKPGGILGVEDHRGSTRTPQDPKAATGYVRQDYATALIERAGFKLIGTSEMDANPRDDANHPNGVWSLPPAYAGGAVDHAKYAAIGEADNFVLKFEKR